MLKFKISDSASQVQVEKIVGELALEGIAIRQLFPNQKRLQLRRVYAVEGGKVESEPKLRTLLKRFGDEIEFVEGKIERKLAG
jgi:hypothetical protein